MGIPICEIFGPTIQGEGALIGQPTVFVRVGGCDYRCAWCDSLYAVDIEHRDTWKRMSAEEIMHEIETLTNGEPILVTLSGGNPAIYDFSALIALGHKKGYHFAMETQGSMHKAYFSELDFLTLSPKPPSAQISINHSKLAQCLGAHPSPTLKVVVANEEDYQFAKALHQQYPNTPMTLQPCNLETDEDDTADIEALNVQLEWLINKIKEDSFYQVTILPQLHVLLWNNKRGV